MAAEKINTDIALALLLNSREIVPRFPEMDRFDPELDEIRELLSAISVEQIAKLAPPLAECLLEAEPSIEQELEALTRRQPTRGVETDPAMIAGLWEAVKADIGYVALLVFFLRTLGYNKIKTKLGEYEGHSIYEGLRSLLQPSQSKSRSRKK